MGLANCQYCGMPLTNTASEGIGLSMTSNMPPDQSQPELPAWLESLRSGERPNTSTSGAANFSASDLVDEGMLPGWMRPGHPDIADNAPSGKFPALPGQRPASMPAPNTDSTFLPGGGMSASSLIDEQSLPSWLQEKQEQNRTQENIAASSLVQPEALPDWMKTIQPQSPASSSAGPIDYSQPINPPQGLMGNDLIDRQALPPWMAGQDTPASTAGQAGLAGSSLLDANAIPPWLREANQEQQHAGGSSPAVPLPAQPGQVPNNQARYNQLSERQAPSTSGNLSAASFIDMNALPDWLRPTEGQQQGFAEHPGQPPFSVPGAPARPDNVRVPSRPRGEIGSHEESEVAANVFASVLGVASAAPHFPGNAYGRPQVPPQPQQNISQQQANPAMPAAQGNIQMPGGYPIGSMPGGPTAGMPPQQPMPTNAAGMQPGPSMHNGMPRQNAKPAKRGFLSTILDWFSR